MKVFSVITILLLITIGFRPMNEANESVDYIVGSIDGPYPDTTNYQLTFGYDQFQYAIGLRESGNNYDTINTLGYMGRYQFGYAAMKDVGIEPWMVCQFMDSPEIQDKAFKALLMRNKYRLRNYIKFFHGYLWTYRDQENKLQVIRLSESGMLAAAHLLGAVNVKKYLNRQPGRRKDKYGTTIEEYLRKFSYYDLSSIQADRKATIRNVLF